MGGHEGKPARPEPVIETPSVLATVACAAPPAQTVAVAPPPPSLDLRSVISSRRVAAQRRALAPRQLSAAALPRAKRLRAKYGVLRLQVGSGPTTQLARGYASLGPVYQLGRGVVTTIANPPPAIPGGVLTDQEASTTLLTANHVDRWQVGVAARLHGLDRCAQLNGELVGVVQAADCDGYVVVRLLSGVRTGRWRVHDSRLIPPPSDGAYFQGHRWFPQADWAKGVQFLPPSAFATARKAATSNFLAAMGEELWPGAARARSRDVEAFYYPLVQPSANLADTAQCNTQVPEPWAHLRTQEIPQQCIVVPTDKVPQPELPEWPAHRQLPMPMDMCRAARGDEQELPWLQIIGWCDKYACEWKKVLRGRQPGKRAHRFNYNVLPGGRNGLIIRDYYKAEYAGFVWDHRQHYISGGRLPCSIQQDIPAQAHTDWRLDRIAADAAEMGYADQNMIYELTEIGFRSFSAALNDNVVCLFPNRKGFWEHPEWVAEKSAEERTGFALPKLFGSWCYPPWLTCRIHPRNVAVQNLFDGSGDIKRRLTTDCGMGGDTGFNHQGRGRGGRGGQPKHMPPPASHWPAGAAPVQVDDVLSFNDGVPGDDGRLHPPLRYSNMDVFAEGLAVLRASGMKLGVFKMDCRAYYRFLVTNSRELHCSIQWVDLQRLIEEDYNLQFGMRVNCASSTRVSNFLLDRIRWELKAEQQRWRDEGLIYELPSDIQTKLASWETDRRAAGVGTEWWADGAFIDDFFGGTFDWFLPTMIKVFEDVFERYNVTMADGRIDVMTNKPSKNKFESSTTALEILGIVLEFESEHGTRKLSDSRVDIYATAAEAMVGQRTVQIASFESLLGRIVFAAQALPPLRGLVAGLLGVLQQHWSMHQLVALGPAAWAVLSAAAIVLRENEGCVLSPMRQRQGADDRPVTWIFTDSARDPDAPVTKYVGYGAWVWPEGSDTVFMANGKWLPGEQDLDITALEYAAASVGLELAQLVQAELWGPAAADVGSDVILVSDNLGSTQVSSSARAKSPSLRVLVQQRLARTARRPRQRVLSVHSYREASEEADDLSKDDLAVLAAKFEWRFGRPMRMVFLPPPANEWRSLVPAQMAVHSYRSGAGRTP